VSFFHSLRVVYINASRFCCGLGEVVN
jgi:hypothetical protein